MIKVVDLNFKYKNSKDYVLKNISFNIDKGEIISIIGHNGSGKSTLAKLLVGLIGYNEGKIFINDNLLNQENIDKIRKDIAIVFQNPDNQFVGVNVLYDIVFGLENHQIDRSCMDEIIDKVLRDVSMTKYKYKNQIELSGGQKQRVAIASVLAINPSIIIFDESTSMLDPEGASDIKNIILELKKNQKTIINITHDLNFAKISDKILVMKDGEILDYDTTRNILNKKDLLKSSNIVLPSIDNLICLINQDEKLKSNEKLKDTLCKYNLKMYTNNTKQ